MSLVSVVLKRAKAVRIVVPGLISGAALFLFFFNGFIVMSGFLDNLLS
jgi:hypothetical protein